MRDPGNEVGLQVGQAFGVLFLPRFAPAPGYLTSICDSGINKFSNLQVQIVTTQ